MPTLTVVVPRLSTTERTVAIIEVDLTPECQIDTAEKLQMALTELFTEWFCDTPESQRYLAEWDGKFTLESIAEEFPEELWPALKRIGIDDLRIKLYETPVHNWSLDMLLYKPFQLTEEIEENDRRTMKRCAD